MKLYYSGFFAQDRYGVLDYMKNILCAFPEMKKNKLDRLPYLKANHSIFLDSWGFSIRNNGLKLNVNDYLSFVKEYWQYFDVIANMDTSFKDETLKNQSLLETSWRKILPVYHWSDLKSWDKQLLEDYCKNYDYIGLWWVAGCKLNKQQKEYYLWYCFSIAMKYKTKIHGFWITSIPELIRYPFYSVDSTSWLSRWKFNSTISFKNWKQKRYNISQSRDAFGVDYAKVAYGDKIIRYLEEFNKIEKYVEDLHEAKKMNYWDL